ncbi:fibronectin type III domain-containing protein [Polaribacter pectinis]|uniref:Fibronectin type III domain-containing protein n=1 Tax=Polaribacter pectinis TaxID=2738844 RepID=A0A7G9L9E8_9FLAO|nr:Ig-like domain-containing protein [Polaribacter pectinis]QNM85247.1 fibronectin type III domain-containing protein [Polaribacter pectinis]
MEIRILFLIFFTLSFSVFSNSDRYRLIITDNPATTITIAWDQKSGTNPLVYYDTTDHGTSYQNYNFNKSVDRSISFKGMNNSFAKLTGLTPNTAYFFVIKDSQGTSARYWFKTAPSSNDTMSFIAGGDSRNNRVPRQNANKMVAKLKPTAVFFGGDMTNANSSAEWIEWMDDWQLTIANDGRMFPIIPARGNHEESNQSIYDLFDTPSKEIYYDITFGTNLYTIYTLNSEIAAGGNQVNWLKGKLASDNSIWKSAQYHKPMRPHQSSKSEGNDEYNNWAQLFYDNKVKLVYESDSHVVKTTRPVKPCSSGANCEEGFVEENNNGIVFVGEGCWGAPLRAANDNKSWTRESGTFNQFKWITVSTTNILVKTIKIDNVNSVGENSNSEAPGVLPSGTDVWSTANGDTVTITNSGNNSPTVAITSHTNNQQIPSGSTTLTADASDTDGTIASVEFKVAGASVGTDTTSPYSITHNFTDGVVLVEVIATDDLGATDSENINLLVGSFSSTIDIAASQDVEQQINNSVNSSSSDLELVYDGAYTPGDQTIGIEFSNINIPAGATITKAYIQFTAKSTMSAAASYLVAVENSANAEFLNTTSGNVTTGRTYYTGVSWSPAPWTAGNATAAERTSDISSQIQSNVNLGSWATGNRMVVKIIADGATVGAGIAKRRARSIDGGFAPVLHIEYNVTLSNTSFNQEKLKQYPNPFKDLIYFTLPSTNFEKPRIKVFSLNGKLVYNSILVNNKVDLSFLTNGTYVVKLQNNKKQTLVKNIIKK